MYKNSRIYGLLYAKLKLEPLASAAYFVILFFSRLFVMLLGMFRSEKIDTSNVTAAKSILYGLYKKPFYDMESGLTLCEKGDVKVSVIVPTYKNSDCLAESLNQLLNQKTEHPYEVILVNDGSPDDTDEAVKPFLDNSRLTYIKKENGGVSSARNLALRQAKGEYFTFMDADDEIMENAVESLVDAIEKSNADIAVGSWKCTDTAGRVFDEYKMRDGVFTKDEFTALREISGVVWGKLFKRELFDGVRFPENYTSFSDTITRFIIFRRAEKIALTSDFVYKWVRNEGGITSTSKKNMKTIQTYWIMEDMLKFDEKLKLSHDLNFYTILLSQFSYINVIRLNGMDDEILRNIFIACCGLYKDFAENCPTEKLPFALKYAHKALVDGDFNKWKIIGKYYRFAA